MKRNLKKAAAILTTAAMCASMPAMVNAAEKEKPGEGYKVGCFSIFKLSVTTNNNKFRLRTEILALADEFQSIVTGHSDICNYDIRFKLPDISKCFNTIVRYSSNFYVQ